jgi:hypothetical protein
LLLTAFFFLGIFLYIPNGKRLTDRKISSDIAKRNTGEKRKTARGSFFRPFLAFSRLGGTLGRVQQQKAHGGKI